MLITADELSSKLGYSSLQSRKPIGFLSVRRAELIVNQLEDTMKRKLNGEYYTLLVVGSVFLVNGSGGYIKL